LVAVSALSGGGASSAWAADWGDPSIGIPLLQSFTTRDTGTLSPCRCTLRTQDGMLYVGQDGLLEYDGETWRTMPLPASASVRALAEAPDGGIWVGGDNLLGVLRRQSGAPPVFTSQRPDLPPEFRRDLGNVNALFALPDGTIVAVTENRVFRIRSGRIQVWSLPAPRQLSAWRDADSSIFIVQPGSGTLRVGEAGLVPAGFPEPYGTEGIEWGVSFKGGARLLGSGGHLLRMQEMQIRPVDGEAAALLREDRVTGALRLSENRAAIATLRHGILILDSDGRLLATLDRDGDMPSDRILHLSAAQNGCITATTADTIVTFCSELGTTYFDTRHGLSGKRIQSILQAGTALYLADKNQLLRLGDSAPAGRWKPCVDHREKITVLLPLGDQVLSASPGALILSTGTGSTSLRTADIAALCTWSSVPSGIAWVEGSHFCRGSIADNQLRLAAPPLEIDASASSLAEDDSGAHWIGTGSSGVIRVAPADQIAAGKPPLRTYRQSLGISTTGSPHVFRVGHHILATTETGLAIYSNAGDRFVPFAGIVNSRIHAVSPAEPDGTVWLALSQRERTPFQIRIARLRPDGDGLSCELVQLPQSPAAEPPSALLATPGSAPGERIFWLGTPGRLLRIESPGTPARNPPLAPRIDALTLFSDHRGSLPIDRRRPRVDFDNNGIRFDASLPQGRLGQRVHLEARLSGFDPDWVPLGAIPSRVFRGLRDGAYRFEARSVDAIGRTSPATAFTFTVLPPWWRSAPAYAAYALCLVLLSGLVFLTRLRLSRLHHRKLEALVAERTRQLAEANAAKSEFLSHINHEIRNPLNGVIGLSTMLANHADDEGTRHLARSLKACAGYLGSVVDNVLDLARIEAGRIEISPQRFAPQLLVEDVAEMFRLQIEEAGGRISWSVDPDLPPALVGDVHRIRQVLVNFTANAARYARGGDVRLSARRRNQTKNRVTVVFTVADTGPGIARDEQARIFEKFARGQNAGVTEATRGYGVGLALVRDLAELLGGEADVDSQLGYGAKFRLTIPLDIAPAEAPAAAPPTRHSATALRTLVIDDQAFNRVILRDQLERLGCKVDEAADAPSALLLIQASAHHMAFVDLDLPGLDGVALIRRIRAIDISRSIFLVATTASATTGIEDNVLAAGADAFLPKPLSAPHLAELLDTCTTRLARSAGSPLLPARPAEPTTPATMPAPASATTGGLFANLALTPDMLRQLHSELDIEAQSLASSWRLADSPGTRHHAHRIASLGLIARDESLVQAARRAEESLQQNRGDASQTVDTLQLVARARIQLLGTAVAAHRKDGAN
jgi:signal transduction histidine kinase/DNA-binding response OmpR family regulator